MTTLVIPSMKTKKIIITGSCGFIGFHVAQIFLKNNFSVIGIDVLTHIMIKN